jgi:aminoglycoside phosphotransferase (APT) family kinase protein
MRLTTRNAGVYLRDRGVTPAGEPVRVHSLSGGISNIVLRAEWREGCAVIKQSLPKLRVEEDWEFDRARIFVERNCMEALAEIAPASVPQVVFSDDEHFVFGMTCAPPGGALWHESNVRSEQDARRAEMAGELLGTMHRGALGRRDLAERFADLMPLEQGRIDPYHRRAAEAHPDLAQRIDGEIDRLLSSRTTLVHGDFAPKNLIAYPDRLLMLDFEVAHWGNPAFDVSFMLTHLVLGSVHQRSLARAFLDDARRFWASYAAAAGEAAASEATVVGQLGCLLLARIDGKSKIGYLTERSRDAVREFSRDMLVRGESTLGPVLDRAAGISNSRESLT